MANQPEHDALVAALVKRARITLSAEPEHDDPAGHFGYDTEAENRAAVEHVRALAERSKWGWCCAHVRASFMGFVGDDYLGACSYESREDFMHPDGYYPGMVHAACACIADQLLKARIAIADLLGSAS